MHTRARALLLLGFCSQNALRYACRPMGDRSKIAFDAAGSKIGRAPHVVVAASSLDLFSPADLCHGPAAILRLRLAEQDAARADDRPIREAL